jgi:hypothetical protein
MKSETKQIGEYQYQVTQVSSGVGLEAAARMANILGPGFGAAPDEGGLNAATLASVLGKVLSNPALSGQLKWFVAAFAERTQIGYSDGRTQSLSKVYEEHFSGEVVNQLDWLRFAFEVNMGSFFAIARKLIASFWAQAKAKEASSDSTSQNSAQSSGGSGE